MPNEYIGITYKLLVNQNKIEESSSLMTIIKTLIHNVDFGDKVEIWERKRGKWHIMDGCVWKERDIIAAPDLEVR